MQLHLLHRTTFVYAGAVRDSFNEVRLRPVEDDTQQCLKFDLRVAPAASDVIAGYLDYYGNWVNYFDLPASHEKLVIEAESTVCTTANAERPPIPTVERTGDEAKNLMHGEYLADSHYVPLAVELWRETQDVFAESGRRDPWTDTLRLGNHVYQTFTYRQSVTGVHTLATDALKIRAGVCQDFAHVLLGLCRSAGMPARYVSGYFLNRSKRPGEVEASHAWIEVLVPNYGWAAFDPTHNRPCDDRYVKLAAGRDYADIRPVSGTFRGAPTKHLLVEVTLRESAGR